MKPYTTPARARSCVLRWRLLLLATLVAFGGVKEGIRALEFPGLAPGRAQASVEADQLRLSNALISGTWSAAGGLLRPVEVVDRVAGRALNLSRMEAFRLTRADGRVVRASDLKLVGNPAVQALAAEPGASTLARRFPGQQITVRLAGTDPDLHIEWRAILRDEANVIRQELVLQASRRSVQMQQIRLIELPATDAQVLGTVPGSPIRIGPLFFSYEHPDAQSVVADLATSSLTVDLPLLPDQPVAQSSVMGVVPEGQMRRGFLYYIERERAHPYRPFLHYNAWYDICWGDRKITERECLEVIESFGRELVQKRGVLLKSFVWDDGWDDPKTLWQPVARNFPNGFISILAAARSQRSTLGFWLSPFGGYGTPKDNRISMGKAQGFETGPAGFSLAGPKYYARFLETCSSFISQDGANFFKFDGLARSVNETEAMLRLTRALRAQKPDLFVSITTGTWPSPFWLWYGDSIWRGGGDMGFHGRGSKREQWMTYRDMETYSNVVQAAPVYPLNSLMTQGFAHARYGPAAELGRDAGEIRRELRSLFASGTCLQELYVTPGMMSAQNWDDLAEGANWAHANADVLVDAHWVGGDPAKGEVYGWAAWARRQGMLALRNPSPDPAVITIELGRAFELPARAPRQFTLQSPWKEDASLLGIEVQVDEPRTFRLAPHEVLVFDAKSSVND